MKSTWYEHEFSAAYEESRVIVIVLGEVPTREEMGPLMWDYIKTNTYLAADDPWFWDKLRYALPHKGRRVFMKRRRAVTDKMQGREHAIGCTPNIKFIGYNFQLS